MANKLYDENSIQAIADAIREMNGSNGTYKVSEMAQAILGITSGGSSASLFGVISTDGIVYVINKCSSNESDDTVILA